jgi:hypothetical protein
MKTIFTLCKEVTPVIGDSVFTVNITEGGICSINSGTNNSVYFTGFLYIGIVGFGKELNFRKIEVVCLDKSGFQVPDIGIVDEYRSVVPPDYYFLQSMTVGVNARYFTGQSPYRFILLLDDHETDSWFVEVLKAKAINDRKIKIDSHFINFSEKI